MPPTSSTHGTVPPGDSIVGGLGEDTCLTDAGDITEGCP